MSILIKGMEMPKDRPQLLWVYPNGKALPVQSDVDPCKELQAVPVPAHGRLIDADALLMRINHEVMEAYMDGACYGVHPNQEYLYLLGEIIDDAPTVIPASDEG